MLHNVSRRAAVVLALIAGAAGPLHSDITLASSPVGVMSKKLQLGTTGLAFPLILENVFVGVVEANAGGMLLFTDSAGIVAGALDSQRPYYAEVVTGALEGERFDVDTAATIAAGDGRLELNLGPGTRSTLPAVEDDALAGARIVVRPHVTLADLPSMIAPALVGDDKHHRADGVNVYEGSGYAFYHLLANGADWGSKASPGGFGDLVIPPDTSIQVVLRASPRKWIHAGAVRTNAFRKNLFVGSQSLGTGFPIALSPVDLAAFADAGAPAGTEWLGNSDPDLADGIQLTALKRLSFNWYFLDADGATWRRVAGKVDATDTTFVGATDAMVLRRNNPDPSFLILPPFEH